VRVAQHWFRGDFCKRSWRNQANGDTSLRVSALQQPTLEAARLFLRPLERADAPFIQQEASAREIADTMISLPHPYPEGESEKHLDEQQALSAQGRGITLAIVPKAEGTLVGLVEIREIDREHSQAELSFWLAQRAWGYGYMTEAVQMVLRYAFRDLGLNRLYAYHMQRNPASGRVLQKNGFHQEGFLRERVRKWDRYEDVLLWAILRSDWED
jgi:RimJ/RimL family protein N-acetyltransferase